MHRGDSAGAAELQQQLWRATEGNQQVLSQYEQQLYPDEACMDEDCMDEACTASSSRTNESLHTVPGDILSYRGLTVPGQMSGQASNSSSFNVLLNGALHGSNQRQQGSTQRIHLTNTLKHCNIWFRVMYMSRYVKYAHRSAVQLSVAPLIAL